MLGWSHEQTRNRSNHPEVFLKKGVLKICSKFTGEHPCRSVISINLERNFIEIALWYGCSPVNFLHIFRTPFFRNASWWLLLLKRKARYIYTKKVLKTSLFQLEDKLYSIGRWSNNLLQFIFPCEWNYWQYNWALICQITDRLDKLGQTNSIYKHCFFSRDSKPIKRNFCIFSITITKGLQAAVL